MVTQSKREVREAAKSWSFTKLDLDALNDDIAMRMIEKPNIDNDEGRHRLRR